MQAPYTFAAVVNHRRWNTHVDGPMDQCQIRVKATCSNPFRDGSCPIAVGMSRGGPYRYMTTGIIMLLFAMDCDRSDGRKDYVPTDDRQFLSLLCNPAYRLIRDYESVEILWKNGSFGGRLKKHASKSLRMPVRMHCSLDDSWCCDLCVTPEMTFQRHYEQCL
jgi:hypothetical protein